MVYGIGIGLISLLGVLAYAFWQKAKVASLERDQAKATNEAWKNMYDIGKQVSVPNITPEERKKKEEEISEISRQLGIAKEGESIIGDPFGLRPPS